MDLLEATASGAVWGNDCTASCAEGTFFPAAVRVKADHPVKGHFHTDQYGSYTANVTSVSVNGNSADISAQVTSSTYPYASVGQTFSWTVYDWGEPGVGHDYFVYHGAGGDLQLPPITAGNLQVHS